MDLIAAGLPHGPGPLLVVPVLALAAWWTRAMGGRGALAGALLGLGIAWGAGWPGVAMLGALLVLGTAATRTTGRRRTERQALCNGLPALLAAVGAGLGVPGALPAVGGALATALGDTVSGELGRRTCARPRLLAAGPRVPAGTDGAMSAAGTLLGALASALVALAGRLAGAPWDLRTVAVVALAGVAGGLVDSALGATLQRGWGRYGNDWVNLAATASGALLAGGAA